MQEENKYNIDFEGIKKSFSFQSDGGLTHKTGNQYRLLPYVANEKTLVSDFTGVVGAFSRNMCGKELKGEFDADTFIEEVADQIAEYEGDMSREAFKDIVRTMFLNEDKLVDFDIKTINYIASTSAEEKIANFIFSTLADENISEEVSEHYDRDVENIMYKLILKSLPELKDKKVSRGEFNCYLPFVKELFVKDFKFILSKEELYKDSLQRFLEYYYMFYVSQLIMKLNQFENADLSKPEKLYYTLDWERTSKTRTAYQFGWEKIKNSVNTLFSHAIVLELLNHTDIDRQLGYKDLAEIYNNIGEEDINKQIDELINMYVNQIKDTNWSNFNYSHKDVDINGFDLVHKLFSAVNYQFEKSARYRANEAYKNWFVRFVQANFSKRRGQLGYNLNITEDDIILMTKICINNNEKLKLNKLFEEFENRGLFFDTDSQKRIIQLFEKLNILEKKSDSGDAQYVKSIL